MINIKINMSLFCIEFTYAFKCLSASWNEFTLSAMQQRLKGIFSNKQTIFLSLPSPPKLHGVVSEHMGL
jgi:hypothetical protein